MIVIWGKLAGLGLGIFGGPIGAVFGILVGHLLDLVAAELLLRHTMIRFLSGPRIRISRQFHPATAAAAVSVICVVDANWQPSVDDTSAFNFGVNAWDKVPETRYFNGPWLRIVRGQPARYLDAALHIRSEINVDSFALRMTEEIDIEDRAKILETCRSTIAVEMRGSVLPRLRNLAHLIGLPEAWIRTALPDQAEWSGAADIDRAACAILGVKPDATLAEVKQAYRRLAAQFHPDTANALSTQQQEASSAAFVRIRGAYDRIVTQLTEGR